MSTRALVCMGLLVLLGGLLVPSLSASPDIFVTDTSLYLELGEDTAFVDQSRTDEALSEALLPVSIRSSNPAWETDQVLNMTIVIEYNPDSLRFDTAFADSTVWDVTKFAFYDTAAVGRLTLAFRGGAMPLGSTFTHVGDVVFTPLCVAEESSQPVPFNVDYRTWIVNRNTGDAHVPTADHCVSGTVAIPDYTAAFDIVDTTFSGSRGQSVGVPVLGTTNNRMRGYHHWIRYNSSKMSVDSVVVLGAWSTYGVNLSKTDTIIVEPLKFAGSMPEADNDTMYIIWVSPTCATEIDDSAKLTPILSKLTYYANPCATELGPTFSPGTVTLDDGVVLNAYLPTGLAEVSRSQSSTVRYNVEMSNSFSAGVQYTGDTGVTMCVVSGTTAFDADNIVSLIAGVEWDAYASVQTDSFAVFQTGIDTVPASVEPADVVAIDFQWNPALLGTPNWNLQYIRPTFLQRFDGHTTMVPSVICDNLIARANPTEIAYGQFEDAVKIRMAQVGTTTASASPCVWQSVRIRANFDVAGFAMVMQVPSNANCIEVDTLLAGVTVTALTNSRYRISGNVAIGQSTNYTDLARFRLEPKYCTSSFQYQNVSLTMVSDSVYSSVSPLTLEFGTPLDAGLARASYRCAQIPCSGIISDPDWADEVDSDTDVPADFALGQNYPNPFNPTTTISLTLPVPTDWRVTIINVAGQVVKEFHGFSGPGIISVEWEASQYASGVYLYRLEAGSYTETKKMILIR